MTTYVLRDACAGNGSPRWWHIGSAVSDTCASMVVLERIRDGSISRAQLEIVLVRGQEEELSWSDPYAPVRTLVNGTRSGREQGGYLSHIVRNYDTLAERTIFFHARAPSCGWGVDLTTGDKAGHLLGGVSANDYVAATLHETRNRSVAAGALLPLTMRMTRDLKRVSMRNSFVTDIHVASPASLFPTGDEHWLPWFEKDLNIFLNATAYAQRHRHAGRVRSAPAPCALCRSQRRFPSRRPLLEDELLRDIP